MYEAQIAENPVNTRESAIDAAFGKGIKKLYTFIINDKDFAKGALENFSYYSLINGYKNTFLQDRNSDNFREGTRFEELYTLHIIDTSLNSILFKYILCLEKALKSRISYLIAERYGVYTDLSDNSGLKSNDYLYRGHYSNGTGRRLNIIKELKKSIAQTRNNPIMLHYINHKNHVPPWILTTNISYGLTIEWYNILRGQDKTAICDSFISPGLLSESETKEFVKKALSLTKEYRNKIAHGNRTFNIMQLPVLPKNATLLLSMGILTEDEYNARVGQNDIFSIFLIILILLNDQYLLTNFFAECKTLFDLYPSKSIKFNGKSFFEIFGMPDNILDRILQLFKLKFT